MLCIFQSDKMWILLLFMAYSFREILGEYIVQSKSDRDTWSAELMDQSTDIKTFASEQKSFFWENEGHTHYHISPLICSVNEVLKIFRKLLQDFL